MNYYHEINNFNIIQSKNTFDILLCGQKSSGKSTFINQFLNEKLAKEKEGLFGTFKIMSYFHPKYLIRIFDTPGWNNNNIFDKILTLWLRLVQEPPALKYGYVNTVPPPLSRSKG